MKQLETIEKVIGENHFYIRPFAAFTAANISGDLAAVVTPLLGGLASAFVGAKSQNESQASINIMDMEIDDALPAISTAFSSLSGDKFERLMKKLLTDHGNISVVCEATHGTAKLMDYELANEVFCGEVQDMFILCWEVIKLNFKGFFKKLGAQFGNLQGVIQKMTSGTENTEN